MRSLAIAFALVIGCSSGATTEVAGQADTGVSDDATPVCTTCSEGVCDPASGACVECLTAANCPSATPICDENTCVECAPTDATCGKPSDPDPPDAGPPSDAGSPTTPTSFEIRLATYNVRTSNLDNSAWGDTHVGFDENDAARMRRIADTVASQKLTVVAFQEMRKPERDAVLARLSSFHGQEWGFTTLVDGADDALVLFRKSVWSKTREVHFVIPLQPGLSSVHFASGDSAAASSARAEAAKRTVKSINDEAVAKKQPFILAGDFNSTSDENAGDVFRASGIMKYTRNVAASVVNNGCKSFNGRAGSEGLQVCFGGVASHIDQVWVPKSGIQALEYKITATQQTSRSSDHNPLTTILKYP